MRRPDGFTLVELVVIIVIVGIVALIAAPRFFAQAGFNAARFQDAAISAIRYGQKVAIAQRTDVFVVADASGVRLCYDAACAGPVLSPADGAAFSVALPNAIGIDAANFNFNALGQPNTNVSRTLTISGDTVARKIVIEQETGYVHK